MSDAARPRLVVLHGAMGSAATMRPLIDAIGQNAEVHALNLLGHGGRPVPKQLSIEHLAADVLAQLDGSSIGRAFVFGYSSGACLALYLARHVPRRFTGVITLAAKYRFDPATVSQWTRLADPARVSQDNRRADALARTHHPQDWRPIAEVNCRMFREWGRRPPLAAEAIAQIAIPALICSSDSDQLVSAEETSALGALIGSSRVVFFHGQSHPLSIVPIAAIARAVAEWMAQASAAPA